MTFSFVARDEDGLVLGAVTASRYLAVGASVPSVEAGVGALVTQAHTNVRYRDAGLRLLRDGVTSAGTVARLVEDDPGRALRQVAVVGAVGTPAAWTGEGCSPVAGQLIGDGCVAVGNLLTGVDVLPAMTAAFHATRGTLARRLLAALAAGDAAGGDRRGRQSAALLVASGPAGGDGVPSLRSAGRVDLRVDDHRDPVGELDRLLGRHELLVGDPVPGSALPLRGGTATEVGALLDAVAPRPGPDAAGAEDLPGRLAAWAADQNLDHRVLPGAVDPALLAELRAVAATAGAGPTSVRPSVRPPAGGASSAG